MPIEKVSLPVGRIVSGNPAVTQNKTNFQTGQPILDENGKKVPEWRCEIAIPKDKFDSVQQQMVQEAATLYPVDPATGQLTVGRDFSWKFIDGDSPVIPKRSKVPYNKREGYPGHYVLKISTVAFAPSIYKFENNAYRQIDAEEIKCGDYVVANIDIKVHNNNDGGLYLNPNGFELVGFGSAISGMGAANPEEMFKQQQHQLPEGASATPIGGAPVAAPAAALPARAAAPAAALPARAAAPAVMAAPGATAPAMPGATAPAMPGVTAPAMPASALPAPAHDFVANVTGTPAPLPATAAPVTGMPAAQPPVNAAQPVTGTAPTATTSPTNAMPGLPAAR